MNDTTQNCSLSASKPDAPFLFGAFQPFLLLRSRRVFSSAEHTRTWRQASYEDFLKGTPHGVAVRSDGRLELAAEIYADRRCGRILSLVSARRFEGALYAAAGPGKGFRFEGSTAGKPTTVFESTDLVAQAIAFDSKGVLYVATSPDGKVYRVSPSGEKTVFFDPNRNTSGISLLARTALSSSQPAIRGKFSRCRRMVRARSSMAAMKRIFECWR